MGYSSLLRSPKKEEQQVPDTIRPGFYDIDHAFSNKEIDVVDELEDFWGIEDEDNLPEGKNTCGQLNWDFMDWEGYSVREEEEESDHKIANVSTCFQDEMKTENCGFWDDHDEMKVSLNLSLNYQEVLDAWSDRGSLWADEYSLSMANNGYMGEVPVMKEERRRREASVLRYKEKRQTRLFSKKIRYQVRKLNADKRPRLKGRFVKRTPEKILK
ncbi:zinc finger protein CONSTANS-LIKE 7-like [Actinidia eriantha]|uniref:zinc finger protein CONSTANS-LIKE 7-like n=1 Tax=Actinidia eriantha TaxID=165200 RepID=UPI0025895228|nr:zinc finger protein CONSTANS-LIKE 7-like [Actinidia eriantha]